MKILTVVGARPQFVKAAVVSRAIARRTDMVEVLVHTGQHYDENMSAVFFAEMGIPQPQYNLGVGSGRHGEQTGRMLTEIERVLLQEEPDWLLIYGDTNSTLAGALAAAKLHIPVAHVEAGLRSFNRRMPEEINRIVADHVATLLLVPTHTALENLRREGVDAAHIRMVGDVMYDATLYFGRVAQERSSIMSELGLSKGGYILATVHRAENTDRPERLQAVFAGLMRAVRRLPVVLPLHPRTRGVLEKAGLLEQVTRELIITPPLGYLDMLMLERNASLIATDSGGVQKEAFFSGVPCVTLRDETEWVELVQAGWNRLAPPTSAQVVAQAIEAALADGRPTSKPADLYGGGDAAERIVAALAEGASASAL